MQTTAIMQHSHHTDKEGETIEMDEETIATNLIKLIILCNSAEQTYHSIIKFVQLI